LKTFLKTALRSLVRRKGISLINISGLALGLAGFLIISLYVQNELSYDKYNANYKRIVRVTEIDSSASTPLEYARTPAPLAEALRREFPAITNTVRLVKSEKVLVSSGERRFYEENAFFADPSILSVFTFPLSIGDAQTALSEPRAILLTEQTARRYFGDADPSGRLVRWDNRYDLKVTGVLKDVPQNSHFHFDCVVSLSSAKEILGEDFLTNDVNTSVYTYLLLNGRGEDLGFRENIAAFVKNYYRSNAFHARSMLVFQPLSEIHLHSDMGGELEPNGDVRYVYIFSLVGFLILLMACMNYTNILTVRYAERRKEIGVRKVLGADRFAIVRQFVGESTVTAALSAVGAVALVELVLPALNLSIDRELIPAFGWNFELDAVLVVSVLLTGVISAGYPSIVLSSLRPVQVFRGSVQGPFAGLSVMRLLVVLQFLISTGLIVSTAIISQQLEFIRTTRIGFDREHIIVLPLREKASRNACELLKSRILQNTAVISAAATSVLPGDVEYYTSVMWNGSGFAHTMDYIYADEDFLKTFGIELAEGRDFSKAIAGDMNAAYLLNETAANDIGWKDPIGQRFTASALREGTVIGVVKDFHYKSLHERIKPLFVALASGNTNYLSIRIRPGNTPAVISSIRDEWGKVLPQSPFEFFFFDRHLDRLYKSDNRLGAMFNWLAGLAIAIACLGLFGLAFISTARKRREIGIRKVFGASPGAIVRLVSGEFVALVMLANLIAWPLTLLVMNRWLEGFAYRISPGIWVFVISSSLILFSAMCVVVVQALRAASANPVDSLRYE